MKTEFIITGTHCKACKSLLEMDLQEVRGITSATVDYTTGATVVEHDGPLDRAAVKMAVEGCGDYAAVIPETQGV